MSVIRIILSIIYVILGVCISVVILMQEGKSNGLGSAIGAKIRAVPWKELWSILPDTAQLYLCFLPLP